MIAGIGCDIIETARVERAMREERFLNKCFTACERAYFEAQGAHAAESAAV